MAIRIALWALLGAALLAGAARAQDAEGAAALARTAEERYAAGDYAGAAALYEALAQAGVRSGAVYYNLGSAYWQAGDAGRALLNYRRTQAFMPRDPDLNARLGEARARRADLLGDEAILTDSLATAAASLLTWGELAWLVWGLWAAACAALALLIGGRRRAAARAALAAALFGLALAGAALVSRGYASASRPAAVVIAPAAAVYSGPGELYLELYQMHAAAEIRVLETQGDWARFVRPDERQGWIRRAAIALVE